LTKNDTKPLLEQADPPRLRFDSQDDALNFARHSIKRSQHWLASHSLNWPERYKKGEIDIVLQISTDAGDRKNDLVFFAVPAGRRDNQGHRAAHSHPPDDETGTRADRKYKPVSTLPTNSVECPDECIPTLVRLERAKKREDIRWKILEPSVQGILNIRGVVRDGEMDLVGALCVTGDCDGVGGMIETGSQPLESLVSDIRDEGREIGRELYFVFLKSLRIALNDSGVWLCVEKGLSPRVDIANLLLCSREPALGTKEGTGHE
jgi:hypothetical protein